MKKAVKYLVLAILLASLVGCASWQNKATSSYLAATSLVTIAEQTAKPSCDAGNLPFDRCGQLKSIYGQIYQGCLTAGNTLKLAFYVTDKTQLANMLANYQTSITQVQNLVTDYINLYNQIVSERKGAPLKGVISPAMIQIIIQAFVAIIGQMPGIINAISTWQLTTVDVEALVAQISAAQTSLPIW